MSLCGSTAFADVASHPHTVILTLLLERLPSPGDKEKCGAMPFSALFDVAGLLLKQSCSGWLSGSPSQFELLLRQLAERVARCPVVESRVDSLVDYAMAGTLKLLTTLVRAKCCVSGCS
jgi:hypothetical protein